VQRGGSVHEVSINDLVVGDVVLLALGDKVPADGIVVESFGLLVDQSVMTGESVPVEKRAASVGGTPPKLAGGDRQHIAGMPDTSPRHCAPPQSPDARQRGVSCKEGWNRVESEYRFFLTIGNLSSN
jgi:magnesium-transporting ATPase (P-type)